MEPAESEVVRPKVEIYTPEVIAADGSKIKFKIPLYQRLFAWEEKTIKGLLEDLKEHFDDPGTSSAPYYLGIITQIYEKPGKDAKDDGYLVVVDGQQRLTVLMLMAACFSHYDDAWKKFLFQGDGYELKRAAGEGNAGVQDKDWKGLARLLPFARPADQECLFRLISQEQETLKKEGKTLLEKGYKTIADFMAEQFPKKEDEDKRKEFSKNIFKFVTLLVTNLSHSYLKDPEYLNRYFEIMNSHYRNLEQHEVLKVQLLTGIQEEKKQELLSLWKICENFSESVLEILKKRKHKEGQWNKQKGEHLTAFTRRVATGLQEFARLEAHPREDTRSDASGQSSEDASQKECKKIADIPKEYSSSTARVTSGGRSIVNFPQSLLLALDIFLENENPPPEEKPAKYYKSAKLLETFKNSRERLPSGQREAFYTFLLRLWVLLDIYVLRREDAEGDSYSVLLGMLEESDRNEDTLWGPEEAHCRLAQYQAMLDAAFPDNFSFWLKPCLKELYELHFPEEAASGKTEDNGWLPAEPDAAADALLAKVKSLDDQRVLKGKILSELLDPAKLKYTTPIDRYWFWRLDYYLWEWCQGRTEALLGKGHRKAAKAYRIRANRSIEHLFPQTAPLGESFGEESALHSFGNLAMISRSLNSQQSNNSVDNKFDRVRSHIKGDRLQSLKLLAMYQAAGKEGKNWTSATANDHETRMIKTLLESFQRGTLAPAGPGAVAAAGEEGARGRP